MPYKNKVKIKRRDDTKKYVITPEVYVFIFCDAITPKRTHGKAASDSSIAHIN
jgi:hypothetical protein